MAAIIVNQALQRIGINASQATGYSSSRYFRTGAVGDGTHSFTATDTAANTGGTVTNFFDVALDSTPTISSQTTIHVFTIPDGSAEFNHKQLMLHDDTVANVTASSSTLGPAVDGLNNTKVAGAEYIYQLRIAYADAS